MPSVALPTGTVTFLFSDIEGSTARWEAHREAMQEALRVHDAIVRACIESNGGHVFKTMGDAFCASFSDPASAVTAACDVQRRMQSKDWSKVDGLQVRIAIHTGVTDERDGDYFGPAVNRVARLLAIGHGGQVIVSAATADLAAAQLPSQTSLRNLGRYRLKDLSSAEEVYQLIAFDLPSEFPELRSLNLVPNNLPTQLTSFVGRQDEITQVKSLLETARLVTLTGAGGAGKTRLALRVAAEFLDGMTDGLWFVDLAPLTDPSLVVSTALTTLGVTETSGRAGLDALVAYLKTRALLLVFDNCEHVIGEAARTAETIALACPHVKVLATSREPLGVTGERVYRIPSLPAQDAVALFIDRARAAGGRFRPEQDETIVAEICERLDGIALAIELAASRTKTLSLRDLAQRLDERFRILTGGSRTALPRQQTLRALIDWSHELLAEREKTLLRRTSSFAGSFSLEAASAVCGDGAFDEWAVLDSLSALVDKSLLVAGANREQSRYRSLQSIREYAAQRLDDARETPTIKKRHAAYFGDLAARAYEEWDRFPGPHWLERLEPDLDNFRAALKWLDGQPSEVLASVELASNTVPIFMRLLLPFEGIRWCERALEPALDLPAKAEARLAYGMSMLFNNSGALDRALRASARAVDLYRKTGDDRGLTRALSQLAQQEARQGNHDEAVRAAAEAVERARASDDRRLLAATLQRSATAFKPQDVERARMMFAQSVRLFRDLRRDEDTARALNWWAETEASAGCFERAIDLSREALPMAAGDIKICLSCDIAAYFMALDRDAEAAERARDGLRLAGEAKHPLFTPIAISLVAAVAEREGDAQTAARLLGFSQRRFSLLEWRPGPTEAIAYDKLDRRLKLHFSAAELTDLFAEGAAWTDDQAYRVASSV